MTFTPGSLTEVQFYLRQQTNLPLISLGVVGDNAHREGYHLGKDRIFSTTGKGWNDYSVKTARDKAGLTNAASAIDVGLFPRLREMSIWIVGQCRVNALDTRWIREIIYSPDGSKVLRWDRLRGFNSTPREGEADNSHQTHSHFSGFRDTEFTNRVAVFKRFFEAKDVFDTMTIITFKVQDWRCRGVNGVVRAIPDRSAPVLHRFDTDAIVRTRQEVRTITGPNGNWRVAKFPGGWGYMLRSDLVELIPNGNPINDTGPA